MMFESSFQTVWIGNETWHDYVFTGESSVASDSLKEDLVYVYSSNQTGRLLPKSWKDKLVTRSPPRAVEPSVTHEVEQGDMTWTIEYEFPNFFAAIPGAWIGVNIDWQIDGEGGLSLLRDDWEFTFDLSGWAKDVTSEGAFLHVDSEIAKCFSRFLGTALSSKDIKLRFVIRGHFDVTLLEKGMSFVGAIVLTMWARDITLRRSALRIDL